MTDQLLAAVDQLQPNPAIVNPDGSVQRATSGFAIATYDGAQPVTTVHIPFAGNAQNLVVQVTAYDGAGDTPAAAYVTNVSPAGCDAHTYALAGIPPAGKQVVIYWTLTTNPSSG